MSPADQGKAPVTQKDASSGKRASYLAWLDDDSEGGDQTEFGHVDDQTPRFELRGNGWSSRLDREVDVRPGKSYDRLTLFDEKATFECAVAIAGERWLLPMLKALLSDAYVEAAHLHQTIVWAGDTGAPLFLWQLGTSNSEVLAVADVALVVARIEPGHTAACVYKGHYEAAPFVIAARRLLSELRWKGAPVPDGAQISIVERDPSGRVKPFVHIRGPSGERGRFPADELFRISVGGMLVGRFYFAPTERADERGWDLPMGSPLRALREHEFVKQGDPNDVLVLATYRRVSGAKVEEAVLTRHTTASYRLQRNGRAPERFVTEGDVAGPFLQRALLRRAYAGPHAFKLSVVEFAPDISLNRAVKVHFERDASHDTRHLNRQAGQQREKCRFTRWGQITTIGEEPKNGSRQVVDVAHSGGPLPGRHERLPRPASPPPLPSGSPRKSL